MFVILSGHNLSFVISRIPFPPVLDGDFFTDSPARALARKNFKRTEILLGVNKEEGHYFILYYLSDILKRQVWGLTNEIVNDWCQ